MFLRDDADGINNPGFSNIEEISDSYSLSEYETDSGISVGPNPIQARSKVLRRTKSRTFSVSDTQM